MSLLLVNATIYIYGLFHILYMIAKYIIKTEDDNHDTNKIMLYVNVSECSSDIQKKYHRKAEEFNSKSNDIYRDAGFDLFINDTVSPDGDKDITFDHKVSCALFKGSKPLAYKLYPRSSISKRNIMLKNSAGIIDSGYRGNLIAKCVAIKDSASTASYEKGERIFQVCTGTLEPFDEVHIVYKLNDTTRGSGGFGSTGN